MEPFASNFHLILIVKHSSNKRQHTRSSSFGNVWQCLATVRVLYQGKRYYRKLTMTCHQKSIKLRLSSVISETELKYKSLLSNT